MIWVLMLFILIAQIPLQIYSNHPDWSPPQDKLGIDARDPNSTTTYNLELLNNGFSGTVDNSLKFKFNSGDSTNFEWKNIFLGDTNDSNNIVADIKYLIVTGVAGMGTYNLPDLPGSKTEVYDKRKIQIFNHADLNRDRKVNFQDFAIFANNWQRTGIVKGSDPNALDDYTDIHNTYDINGNIISYGDGVVDFNDLGEFVTEWLWDADDETTW